MDARFVPDPVDCPSEPIVEDGGGNEFEDGLVGTLLDKEVLSGLGFVQLNQLMLLGPVVLHPVDSRQGKQRIPALIQVLCDKTTRMATRPSLNKLESICGSICQHKSPQPLCRLNATVVTTC